MKLENIKKTLDQRTIAPSPDSWDRLAKRLDSEQKQTKKSVSLWWISAVAAIIVVVLLVITQTTKQVNTFNNNVVQQNDAPTKSEIKSTPQIILGDMPVSEQPLPQNKPASSHQLVNTGTPQQPATRAHVPKTKQSLAGQLVTSSEMVQKVAPETTAAIQTAMVAQEQRAETKPATVTLTAAQEAEMLLEHAMGTIKTTRQTTQQTVYAERLLLETEWDLEADRRNRVENMLLDQFGKLKAQAIALIDRN